MKKTILASLIALSLLAISTDAREYKCNDKDVILAGIKANPSSRGTPVAERMSVYKNYRPWPIENVKERGFTKDTMIGCTANSDGGGVIFYVVHIDKETGKAYVNSHPTKSYDKFKKVISKKGHGAYIPLN
jgi:hypothetical protein